MEFSSECHNIIEELHYISLLDFEEKINSTNMHTYHLTEPLLSQTITIQSNKYHSI